MIVIAQAISIIAMAFNILSFQCKRNRNLIMMIGAGSLLFSVSFMMLGDFSSAGFNLVNIFNSTAYLNKKTHNNVFFSMVYVLYILVAIFAYKTPWTIVLLFAQLASAFAQWHRSGAFIRKTHFLFVSPAWLINNIFITFSIGGIICELFMIASVLISFIRFRKSGFDV